MDKPIFVFRRAMRGSVRADHHQQGVVLIVALVMLVIIGLASVAIMRNVMSNDLVSENNRRHTQAMQAAQTALRYCEGLLTADTLTPRAAVATVSQEEWHTFSNWLTDGPANTGGPLRLPADVLNSGTGGTGGTTQSTRYDDGNAPRPQCMAQERNVNGTPIIVVTARGFSDNFVDDQQTGRTKSGAVVWLQSFIQLAATSSM